MIARDGHDGALRAAPKSRHHFQAHIRKYNKYQIDNKVRRMMHNHPSGDPTPSRQDIDMTRQVVEAGRSLKISVHDHLVVGREGVASFKALGLF